jgi:hypothetical protein
VDEHDQITRPRIDPSNTPFTETEAFRRYGASDDPDPDSPEALYTKAVIQEQGFDGLPHVVTRRELDRYVAAGEVELYRGVTEARFAEQWRSGDFFVGREGVFDGMYAAAGPSALAVARHYAAHGDGTVIRMSLKAGARVVDGDEFEDRVAAEWQHALRPGRIPSDALRVLYYSLSCYATYVGYDAVHVIEFPEVDQYIVLNRTALRVQKENIR